MSLTTTQLSNHFGVSMSAEFVINTLGVPNTGKEKRAFLWDESKVRDVGLALAKYVTAQSTAPVAAPKKTTGGAADDLF